MNAFKAKDVPWNAIYLMPYHKGSIYMVKWPDSYTLMFVDRHGHLCCSMGEKASKIKIDYVAEDFIYRADPKSYAALVLRDLMTRGAHPSIVYAFIESKGAIYNKDNVSALSPHDTKAIVEAMSEYNRTTDKMDLIKKLHAKNYYDLVKYVDQLHETLSIYFSEWVKNENEAKIQQKAEDVSIGIQKVIQDSNSYDEYVGYCSTANVPKDCILCLPALSKAYALALIRSSKLLKEYKGRPKDSDLVGVLHTTEKGLVGLKLNFTPTPDNSDYAITVGTTFINHDAISRTKGVDFE